jgi:hypothetical protein
VSVCGLLALALAVVGLYGAIAYLVTRRTREIGVRIALGATPDHVLMLVVRQGCGSPAPASSWAWLPPRLAAQALPLGLYGVTPLDPRTYVAVMVLLALTAAVAAFVPSAARGPDRSGAGADARLTGAEDGGRRTGYAGPSGPPQGTASCRSGTSGSTSRAR